MDHLFLIQDLNGDQMIGFKDKNGYIWSVNPIRLYRSLFLNISKETFVDQAYLFDKDGCACGEMEIYQGYDGRDVYWLFAGEVLRWADDGDYQFYYDDFYNTFRWFNPHFNFYHRLFKTRYSANVIELICKLYNEIEENGFGNQKTLYDDLSIVMSQLLLEEFNGRNPWQKGFEIPNEQEKFYLKCNLYLDSFSLDMTDNEFCLKWELSRDNIRRHIKTAIIPPTNDDLILLRLEIEKFLVSGSCEFRFRTEGDKYIHDVRIFLNSIRNRDLTKIGGITEVLILPANLYDYDPPLYGFVNTKQTIKTIYEFFLNNVSEDQKDYLQSFRIDIFLN